MSDTDLNIYLRLRDQLSKPLKGVRGALQSFRKNWLLVAAGIIATVYALRKFSHALSNAYKDIIKVSAKFENWQIQLEAFTNSTILAKKKLKELIDFSVRTPFTPEEVLDVSALLLPLEQAGYKLEDLLTMAGNIAAAYPMTFKEAALNLNKALSAGMGAARLFYEQGVRAHMQVLSGIEDLTRVSQEDLAKIFYSIYADPSSPLARGIQKLSRTYEGLMSTLKGEWFLFKEAVGEKVFESVKQDLKAVLVLIRKSKEEGGKYEETVRAVGDAFETGYEHAQDLIGFLLVGGAEALDIFNDLRVAVTSAAIGWLKLKEFDTKLEFWTTIGRRREELRTEIKELRLYIKALEEVNAELALSAETDYSTKIAKALSDLKAALAEVKTELPKAAPEGAGNPLEGLKGQLEDAKGDLGETFDFFEEMAKQSARNVQDAFSDFFFKAFTGELRNLKEVFADFGRSMLQMFSNLLAQKLVLTMFPGLGSKQSGSPYIPRTGPYLLHRGEKVIPAHQAATGESVVINVNQFIQAWDASDVYRNRKVLAGAIAEEIKRNAPLREVIKAYG